MMALSVAGGQSPVGGFLCGFQHLPHGCFQWHSSVQFHLPLGDPPTMHLHFWWGAWFFTSPHQYLCEKLG